MAAITLNIRNLQSSIGGKEILKGVNLRVRGGEIHVIMGPNGTGKSTLASSLMGHPAYRDVQGEALLNGEDLLQMTVDERARKGLFLAMQYPAEIPGVTNSDFLRAAVNARRSKPLGIFPFRKGLAEAVDQLQMNHSLPQRYLNEGFSGGEKKRNEILQLLMLHPAIAILDEIDSGLDIDALRIVGENVTRLIREQGEEMGLILITHYQRLLDYIQPDFVHVLMNGRIVRSGGPELALKLESEGYDWLRQELGEDEENYIQAAQNNLLEQDELERLAKASKARKKPQAEPPVAGQTKQASPAGDEALESTGMRPSPLQSRQQEEGIRPLDPEARQGLREQEELAKLPVEISRVPAPKEEAPAVPQQPAEAQTETQPAADKAAAEQGTTAGTFTVADAFALKAEDHRHEKKKEEKGLDLLL